MFLQRFLIILSLIFFFEQNCIAQKSILFEGLRIGRSTNYPLNKVKTNLAKIRNWHDSIVSLDDTSIDTSNSIKPDVAFFTTNCKSIIFKEMAYVNSLYWMFKKSDSNIIVSEIYFENPKKLRSAYFFMKKNMPKYQINMVGEAYFDWFLADDFIYLIHLNHNEGLESDKDYLAKAKRAFQEILGQ